MRIAYLGLCLPWVVACGSSGSGGELSCQEQQQACEALSASECERREECTALEGARFEGDLESCLAEPPEFLGCVSSGCSSVFATQGCIYAASSPDQLYCQNEIASTPGWECVVECLVPEGLCRNLESSGAGALRDDRERGG